MENKPWLTLNRTITFYYFCLQIFGRRHNLGNLLGPVQIGLMLVSFHEYLNLVKLVKYKLYFCRVEAIQILPLVCMIFTLMTFF